MLSVITIALLITTGILIILARLSEPGQARVLHVGKAYYCGKCKGMLYPKQRYCSVCGSRLVWEDENE